MVADSQTLLCTYLSAGLLVRQLANRLFRRSWADPVAALAIAAVAVKEGRDAWQGEGCCGPSAPFAPTDTAVDTCGCQPGCTCS